MVKQVGSISGGRTSHYMISELIERYGKGNVDFVFCDTGAEHQGTYDFVRDTAKHFGIEITCIRLDMPQESGEGARYVVVGLDDIKPDYRPFRSLMTKYGRPFNPGGKFCTDQMKTKIYRKYCNDVYGKGQYHSWIGYRAEPKDSSRVWGHNLSVMLNKWFGIHQREQGQFYIDCRECLMTGIGDLFEFVCRHIPDPLSENNYKRVVQICDRVVKNYQIGYRFLFEISDFDKQDIYEWWDEQDFDLNIPNHCGNCVFCIEKTTNQLAYLCHTQPQIKDEWLIEVINPDIPIKGRKISEDAMYRNSSDKLSFEQVIDLSNTKTAEEWEEIVGMERKLSPCAGGSCDLYNGDE